MTLPYRDVALQRLYRVLFLTDNCSLTTIEAIAWLISASFWATLPLVNRASALVKPVGKSEQIPQRHRSTLR